MKELKKIDCQFAKTYHSADNFKVGQFVFLKSNPEVPLIVFSLSDIHNTVEVILPVGVTMDVNPRCLLKYKDACNVIYKGKYLINLN